MAPSRWRRADSSVSSSRARRMRERMSSLLKGFSMKSQAPRCSAETAIGTSPWPVTKMIGNCEPSTSSFSCSSRPLISGIRTSSTRQPRMSSWRAFRKLSAEWKQMTRKPSPSSSQVIESRIASSSSTTKMVWLESLIAILGRFLDRYGEMENSAAFAPRRGPQAALVELDDRAADGQPDAHALGLGGVERGENLFHVLLGQPVTLVGDGDLQHAVVDLPRVQGQLPAFERHVAHRLDAVLDQIEQHLLDHDAVDDDVGQMLRQVEDDLRAGALGLDVGKGAGFVDQRLKGDRLPVGVALLDHVAHAANDLAGPFGLFGSLLHRGQQVGDLVVAGLHALDAAGAVIGDGRQRLVEFVRQGGRHFAHGDQPRGLLQALLLLEIALVDVLLVGDVGSDLDAYGASVDPADRAFVQVIPMAGQHVLDLAVEQFAGQLIGAQRRRIVVQALVVRPAGGGDQRRIAADAVEAEDALEGAVGEEELAAMYVGDMHRRVQAVDDRLEALVGALQLDAHPLRLGDVVH